MRRTRQRALALSGMLALLLAACPDEPTDRVGPDGEDPDEFVELDPDQVGPLTYEMGIFEDLDNDSYWAFLEEADVWSGYVLAGTGSACNLYGLSAPNFAVTPSLATHDWEPAEQEGDVWVVEVDIHEGVSWSDGEPITAYDMEFTWQTVLDFPLGGQWLTSYEPEQLEAGTTVNVEALDETTVRIEWSAEPGLATWPMALGTAPIMAEHHWGALADEHDDVAAFLAESGQGTPSCGPFVFDQWEEGAFASAGANEHFFLSGTEYIHYGDGTVEMTNDELGIDGRFGEPNTDAAGADEVVARYRLGPYAEDVIWVLYGDAAVGTTALIEGEIPFLLTGPGLEAAAQDEIIDAEDVEAVINPNYGMQYLGFNFGVHPLDDQAVRQAIATVIDREYITDVVMGGSALPLYGFMPPGNELWYDEAHGEELAERWEFADMGERVRAATELLAQAGYSWDLPPEVDGAGEIRPGEGLTDPDGEPVPELDLHHPTAGYDPLRHTAGLHVADFIRQLGFRINDQATEFSQLVEMTSDPDNLTYDLIILGWSLGNPALPTYYDAFWRSDSPINNTGYASAAYDEAVAEFMAASSIEDAQEILWGELEPTLTEDVPYVPLFDTPRVEGYRPEEVRFPYTEVLGGLEFVGGQPELVIAAE